MNIVARVRVAGSDDLVKALYPLSLLGRECCPVTLKDSNYGALTRGVAMF